MFKRIALTAFLGGALLFSIPNAATAHNRSDAHSRHDNNNGGSSYYYGGGAFGVGYGGYDGSYVSPLYAPRLQFRGFDRVPGFYYAPPGIGASSGYYLPYLADSFGDDYFQTYGYRCNGYRDGYYYGSGGRDGSYRHNADCDDFYVRHGYWYGAPVCDRYDANVGYCDN